MTASLSSRSAVSRVCLSLVAVASVTTGIGCKSHPGAMVLQAFQQQQATTLKGLWIVKYKADTDIGAYDEIPYAENYNTELAQAMDVLGNEMGFKVEVANKTLGSGFLSHAIKSYRVISYSPKALPGVTVKEQAEDKDNVASWAVIPDFKDEVVIEKATSIKDGIEDNAKRDLNSLSGDLLAAGKAEAARRIDVFEQNTARAQSDIGAKKAWWVEYRHRISTVVPADSPFWKVTDALAAAPPAVSPEPYNAMLGWINRADANTVPDFYKSKGQADVGSQIKAFTQILFEGSDGKLVKSVGWKTFLPQ